MILDHLNKQFYCSLTIKALKVLPYRLTIFIIWRMYLHFHFLSQILRGLISRVDCSQLFHDIGGKSFVQQKKKIPFLVATVIFLLILLLLPHFLFFLSPSAFFASPHPPLRFP